MQAVEAGSDTEDGSSAPGATQSLVRTATEQFLASTVPQGGAGAVLSSASVFGAREQRVLVDSLEADGLVDARLVQAMSSGLNISALTQIQAEVIPQLAGAGRDALVQSQTGSGKTLAYLVPLVQDLQRTPSSAPPTAVQPQHAQPSKLHTRHRLARSDGTRAIVLLPTRELAQQVFDVAVVLTKPYHWLVCRQLRGQCNTVHVPLAPPPSTAAIACRRQKLLTTTLWPFFCDGRLRC